MSMFVAPAELVHASFLAAMAEFCAEGRGGPDDASMVGREIREFGGGWDTPTGFAEYTRRLREQALEDAPRPPGFVPCTTLWWIDGAEYLGRLAIRHRLTPGLREAGGHIGYDVRRSVRGRGHATRMLRVALPVAHDLGIESALVTCDEDNVPSRKVIEKNGGVLEDRRGDVLRFWVPTRPGAGDRPRAAGQEASGEAV
jgi:predicted acetyltransferase